MEDRFVLALMAALVYQGCVSRPGDRTHIAMEDTAAFAVTAARRILQEVNSNWPLIAKDCYEASS